VRDWRYSHVTGQNLRIARLAHARHAADFRRDSFLRGRRPPVSSGQARPPFFPLERDEFYYPPGRTERYTIVEFSMFEGRTVEAKKKLIRLLFERFESVLGIGPNDVEITIFETPMRNWGFRGLPGDEHALNYKVQV
jgi:phenylpyruvate tautomerase PptA (4-oxalocrotonate tautomerase family)